MYAIVEPTFPAPMIETFLAFDIFISLGFSIVERVKKLAQKKKSCKAFTALLLDLFYTINNCV